LFLPLQFLSNLFTASQNCHILCYFSKHIFFFFKKAFFTPCVPFWVIMSP